MEDSFPVIANFVLAKEGGYVNHPNDPGGETNLGISDKGDGKLDGKFDGVPIKTLTREQALAIYRKLYWTAAGCEELPFELAACVFDTAVNMGVKPAKDLLVKAEGDWIKYLQLRMVRYKDLIARNPKLKVFEKGWTNRVVDLKRFVAANQWEYASQT